MRGILLKKQIHIYFYGEVQGVGFRVTARRIAMEMSIKGFARNCRDGSVEVVAQAEPAKIEHFVKRLQEIFPVDEITRQDEEIGFVFSDFSVL